jgi:ABC-2 type transport system ATP-binding protein
MSNAIEVHDLRKTYSRRLRSQHLAVDSLDLEVPRGGVYGFLGPNGSGKTTTIRCLLGLVTPTSGTLRLFGRDVRNELHTVIAQVGAIVESPALFPTMTGRRNLELLARPAGIGPRAIQRVLEQVTMVERADHEVRTYSLGMRQRLAVAAALLKDPELVILDEPANGLDPAGIKDMRRLMRKLADDGRTVFVSSHHLAEIEHVCDSAAIIAHGRCITAGPVHDILHRGTPSAVAVKVSNPDAAIESLTAAGVHARLTDDGLVVDIEPSGAAWVNRVLADSGLWLSEMRPIEVSLEDVFLELTGTEA